MAVLANRSDPFDSISWIDGPFALGKELADEGIDQAFAELWNNWCRTIGPDSDSITIEARPSDDPWAEGGELVFLYDPQAPDKKPLELHIRKADLATKESEQGKVLERTYALLALLTEQQPILRAFPPPTVLVDATLPSTTDEEPAPVPAPSESSVGPAITVAVETATAPLPGGETPANDAPAIPATDVASAAPSLQPPDDRTAAAPAETIPTALVDAAALPTTADIIPALVPAPSEPGIGVPVVPLAPPVAPNALPVAPGPPPADTPVRPAGGTAPVVAGKYLLPLEPATTAGRPLSAVIEGLTHGSLPTAAAALLGALKVRRGFVVITSQFKGAVLEVELTDPVDAIVRLAIGKEVNLWTFGGEVIFLRDRKPPLIFTLTIGSGADATCVVAALDGDVNLVDDLFKPMFGDRVSIPDGFGVDVTNPLLVLAKQGDSTKALVSVSLGLKVDLADLPFVGQSMKALGAPEAPELVLSVLYATGPFVDREIASINSVVSGDLRLPRSTDQALEGLLLSVAIKVTGEVYPLCVPLSKGAAATPAASATPSKDVPAAPVKKGDKQVKWFDVNRSIGPVRLQRVGAGYWDGAVQFRIAGSVQVSVLTFSVEGLGGGLTLTWPPKPSFNLDGLGLGLETGAISVSGALLRTVEDGVESYDGMAMIKAAEFAIAGLGSYSKVGGEPSLFVFVILYQDLGGPAFFHVTGLAGGMGYNRTLKRPPIDEVQSFPLVRAALDEKYLLGADVRTTLTKLRDYISPSAGEYWFAVGVRFSTFELLESVALLAVSFGKEIVISVLGLSRLNIPKVAPSPIAYAELQLKAELNLSTGTLTVEGRLSRNSFILDRNCRLTGGFAFYTWFVGEHAGDFVVTIGGYHPRFVRPSHYPLVPRVGIDWPISDELRITGELYFALTPSCLMAGGRLSAVFQDGGLRAWFIAYTDFLLQWQPFHYEIEAGLSLGVSYTFRVLGIRVTLKVELSVELALWGPPFAGRAKVTWYIISFTIRFGNQGQAPPPPLTWKQFEHALLPTTSPLITLQVSAGLISQGTVDGVNWPVVNAHELALTTKSAAPATTIRLNGAAVHVPGDDRDASGNLRTYGVQPMAARSLTSDYDLQITRLDGASYDRNSIVPTVLRQGVPAAMWSPRAPSRQPTAEVLSDAPTGLALRFPTPEPTHELLPVSLKTLAYEDIGKEIVWRDDLAAAEPIPAPGARTLMNTLEDDAVRQRRQDIVAALRIATPAGALDAGTLQLLAKTADRVFQASPRMARLGQPLN